MSEASTAAAALAKAFRAILPEGVRVDARPIDDAWQRELLPEEAAATGGFAPRRRAEFATGRASLRNLLQSVPGGDAPLLVGARRAPIMPVAVRGSITHCGDLVVTAAAAATAFHGIGIDLEATGRITPDLQRALISEAEVRARPTSLSPDEWLARCFSGKEAAFKAIHGLIGRYIDFHDLTLCFAGQNFVALPRFENESLADKRIVGVVGSLGQHTIASAWVPCGPEKTTLELAFP